MSMNTQTLSSNGIVVAKSNSIFTVSLDHQMWQCQLATKLANELKNPLDWPVVGDRVQLTSSLQGVQQIERIDPRKNLICRRSVTGKQRGFIPAQPIAANVDQLVGVLAIAQPQLKWGLVDRYLVMAESQGLDVLLCLTKHDLAGDFSARDWSLLEERCALYRDMGYRLLFCSVVTRTGLPELQESLTGRTSLLIGKSGVGKTSLLNLILPDNARKVSAVNEVTGKGRHTTTALQWLPLAGSGAVIDTPGTRELGLWDVDPQELELYFPEIRVLIGRCKFRLDCTHTEEPGCAVRQAVVQGQVDPFRYQSFLKLREEWR